MWLLGAVPEEFRPDKVKCVITATDKDDRVTVHVHNDFPDAWRRGRFGRWLWELSGKMPLAFVIGDKRRLVAERRAFEKMGGVVG